MPLSTFVERTTQHALDQWQYDLCDRLEDIAKSKGRRVLIHAPPQYGKPCYIGSMVLMADGTYKELGTVQVGNYVITHKGQAKRVSAVFEQGDLECVEITTRNGRKTVAALDHPFLTPEGWIEAGKLAINQSLACVPEAQCGGSDRRDEEFELLGYFVGDGAVGPAGTSIHANITSNDPLQAQRFMAVADRLRFKCRTFQKQKTAALTYAFSAGIRQWLRECGIAGCKSSYKVIPDWVYRGSNEQIALFLGAYFSCDGTVSPKGLDRHGNMRPDAAVEFYSVSEPLLRGVQSLLLRVGVQSKLAKKNGRYQGNRHDSYRLSFTTIDNVAQFAAKVPVPGRKGELLRSLRPQRKSFQPLLLADPVISVEKVGLKPCRCLTVEDDHTFTVDDLVVHNSIIVSQRFPAWVLARDPQLRVKLACYNVTHATRFAKIVRDLMQSDEFAEMFPYADTRLPEVCRAEEWSTFGRLKMMDSQPSFKALGLATGFVGQGADLLIIDDPYRSPEEAYSEIMNGHVQAFWTDTAKPRLNDNTNVVVMFHRYKEDDLAGFLMETEPDEWELIRYAAIGDGDFEHPTTKIKYPDPLNRKEGEKLSDRFSDNYYARQAANTHVWLSQFQGRPTAKGGLFFQRPWFKHSGAAPRDAIRIRYWDKAGAAPGKGDWTVGVLMARDKDGIFYIEDVVRGQWRAKERNDIIKQTAELDEQKYGQGKVKIFIEQPPGLAKESTDAVIRHLAGFPVKADPVSGDKVERAEPFQSQADGGNVRILRAIWNAVYLDELTAFPAGKNDDQVDASSGAFNILAGRKPALLSISRVDTSASDLAAKKTGTAKKANPANIANRLNSRLTKLKGKKRAA